MSGLSVEQIRLLAAVERQMDAGEVPFVVTTGGGRMAVMPTVMSELGLVSGQTVGNQIVTAILQAQIAALKARLEMEELAEKGGPHRHKEDRR